MKVSLSSLSSGQRWLTVALSVAACTWAGAGVRAVESPRFVDLSLLVAPCQTITLQEKTWRIFLKWLWWASAVPASVVAGLAEQSINLVVYECETREDLAHWAGDADVVWVFGSSRCLHGQMSSEELSILPRCGPPAIYCGGAVIWPANGPNS